MKDIDIIIYVFFIHKMFLLNYVGFDDEIYNLERNYPSSSVIFIKAVLLKRKCA